ncbi:8-oxo-dGTP diphosphatase [Patescibacteria group bacterium]
MQKEKILKNATICFLVRKDEVLLAVKADKIGKGCRNGYGGGIKAGESPETAAIRELEEEAEITVSRNGLKRVAIVDFHNTTEKGVNFVCKCHIYLVRKWEGTPEETAEMLDPQWFKVDNLPLDKMMPADPYWIPVILEGKKIIAKAKYGPHQKELIGEVEIREVDSLPEN